MRHYEMMMILSPDVEERNISGTLDKLLAVITAEGGTIDNIDTWGRRKMTFEIKKRSEGVYVVVDFTATAATMNELDRQLGLNEQVLRTKILVKEQPYAQRAAKSAKAAKAEAVKVEVAKPERVAA